MTNAETYYRKDWNTPALNPITGTEGNDNGPNGLVGGRGDDIIRGLGGNDLLWGRNGSDELIGGKGNDFLEGEKGIENWVDYDTYVFRPGDGFDYINILQLHEQAAGDLLRFEAANGADPKIRFSEYNGDAVIVYGDGGGGGVLRFHGEDAPSVTAGENGGTVRIGNMSLAELKASNLRLHVVGDERDNRLNGAWGDDIVEGGDGDDRLRGRDGDDRLWGEAGNDFLHGGAGDDFLHGGAGNDTLRGGKGDDVLYGGGGDDTLYGGRGNDTLEVWGGTNTLTGGAGRDRFHFIQAEDASVSTVTDFEDGLDTIIIRGQTFRDIAIAQEGEDTVIRYGNAVITLEDVQAPLLTEDDFTFVA